MTDNIKNMELYRKLETPPEWAMKKIGGGRLSGKTDINPQWRIEALTEQFGPCGVGWYFTVDKKWTEEGAGGEKMVFVDISLYCKIDGEWTKGIYGNGGNKLIESEKAGMHNNDEAYKMATTDAIGTACKSLGIGGLVYRNFKESGSKYQKDDADASSDAPQSKKTPKPISELKEDRINEVMRKSKCTREEAWKKIDDYLIKKSGKGLDEIETEEELNV